MNDPNPWQGEPDDDKKALEEAIETAKKELESDDKEKLEAAAKELTNKIMTIGAQLYEQTTTPNDDKKEDNKDDKEGPVEGEVIDDDKKDK